jgi:hypothetical protein
MKKKTFLKMFMFCGILAIGLAGIAIASSAVDGDEPAMMVSPSVVILDKLCRDSTLTVHTNIPASDVEPGSMDLDGVAPTGVGIDSCGHIVAKFAVADMDLGLGEVTLTLSGAYTEEAGGGFFSATDVVTVK